MEHKLERKYGLFTAICLVVGIVIGSGVFFKAQTILQKTEGNMPLGIIAWVIGGLIMLVSILTFATMAQKYEKVNGIVDYAEATVGSRYGYFVGWFMTAIYYPSLTSVLCWLSARYTLVFITSCWPNFPLVIPAEQGGCVIGPECIALMMLFLCCAYFINAISPKLAGKFQTTTTIIKLIPLGLMAVVGIISGLVSPTHMLANNFAFVAENAEHYSTGHLLLSAVCATAFAYEGWIIATSINAELKDAKRNLPKALIIGGIIIIAVYIAYYVGVAGGATVETLMVEGATSAFVNIFGGVLGNILNLFIAISCMGTMNGLMLGCSRGLYSLAARGEGPAPEIFRQIDPRTNMPANSSIFALLVCGIWGTYFYLSNLAGTWSGPFVFDSSEIPIVTLYALYLPIFICWIKKEKDESVIRRFVLPILAIIGALFMVYACIVGHGMENVWYLIVFAVVMAFGALFVKKEKK
ncbi:MAG: APC family permease [Firmicutes bacterium]|nr:APC family permease [Bacillota bacterium]